MKNLITIFILMFAITSFAQPGKRLNIKSGLAKCVDALGDPIEDCMIMSLANGEFKQTEIADVVEKLNISNAGNIDSIYSSANGDTLIVDYIVGDDLKYYAPGINGILSTGNNNKKIGGTLNTYTTLLPTTLWTLSNNQSNPNQFNIQFSTSSRQLLITTGAAQLEPLRVSSYIGTTSSSRVWRTGSAGGNYNILDATTGGTPTRLQILPGGGLPSIPSLVLQADGDVQMGQYDVTRSLSNTPTNFAGFDATGVLQKYNTQELVDSIYSQSINNYDSTEQVYYGETFFGDTIYWRTWYFEGGANEAVIFNGLLPTQTGEIVRGFQKSYYVPSGVINTGLPVEVYTDLIENEFYTNTASESQDYFITLWYTKQ